MQRLQLRDRFDGFGIRPDQERAAKEFHQVPPRPELLRPLDPVLGEPLMHGALFRLTTWDRP